MILGLLLLLFATIGLRTPVWVIVLQAFCYGAFTSLQYTSMNTLVFADIAEEQTSNASSIASTMQQMSISFGVASLTGLATAIFIPDRLHSNPAEMIHGIHEALLTLGLFTLLSTIIFHQRFEKRRWLHGQSTAGYTSWVMVGAVAFIHVDGVVAGRDWGHPDAGRALAWLLQRSPNILLIPGTSSVAHLRREPSPLGS